ncbi:unnamed protein product [Strongylus vulgaris]|uniref:Uncharacterized protein n=1 Tax=Strongylus vulgaris TaxID=40348 RepID=A0A3P7IK38_STRVU|nr:unnamed protein product [Strongylus vulgaris]
MGGATRSPYRVANPLCPSPDAPIGIIPRFFVLRRSVFTIPGSRAMVVEFEIFSPRYSRIMSAIDMDRCEYQSDNILYCPQNDSTGVAYYVRNVYPPIQVRF